MSIDGIFIKHLVSEFQILKDKKIIKIDQINRYEFIFHIRIDSFNKKLFISTNTNSSRIHFTEHEYIEVIKDNSLMLLKNYLEGSIIKNVYQHNNDRIIIIDVQSINKSFDYVNRKLIIELFGRNSNLILLENELIIFALRYSSLTDTHFNPILHKGIYIFNNSSKINPFSINEKDLIELLNKTDMDLLDNSFHTNFEGMSKYFTKELAYRKNFHKSFFSILNEIYPSLYGDKFYYTKLTHLKETKTFNSLSELLDYNFNLNNENQKESALRKSLNTFLNNIIDRASNKIEKLHQDLLNNKNFEDYKMKGDLILSNLDKIKSNPFIVKDLNDKTVSIDIDISLSLVENANYNYKLYKKKKESINHIKNQIDLTNSNLNYYNNLKTRLDNEIDLNDFIEELSYLGYINNNIKKQKNSNSNPLITTYIDELENIIMVGKNNKENAFLTHKKAKNDDYFFHIKDGPGSHVIVKSNKGSVLKEKTIRTAAMLCAYYSNFKDSSSIPVDYTLRKYVKKIPKKESHHVIYTNHKTIYIDINIDYINSLRKKKT